jgi:hypothetical protein
MTNELFIAILASMKLSIVFYIIAIFVFFLVYLYFKMENSPNIPILSDIKKKIVIEKFPENKVIGSWLWQSPYTMSEEKMTYYINKSSEEGINTIYLDIGQYLDLYEELDTNTRETNLSTFNQKTSKFLELAAAKNIKVEALSGGANWADEDYNYLPLMVINYVHNYNKQHKNKFSGIHFDIESWNNEDFNSAKITNFENYLIMADQIVKENIKLNHENNADLKISFDIAYWLDNSNGNVPAVNWNNEDDYPLFHLLKILNQDSGNKIVIMAYRNTTDGKSGSIRISKEELDYIADNNLNIDVLIGEETAENEIPSITFFGSTKNDVKIAANNINNAYQNVKQFKGIAIHNLDSYLNL